MAHKAQKPAAVMPYDANAQDPRWLDALNTWVWHQVPGQARWTTSGNCPRCGHPTALEVEATVTLHESLGGDQPRLPAPPATATFRCFCATTHQAGKQGCGLRMTGMRGPR